MSGEVPALLARQLGATQVVAVHLPVAAAGIQPRNMFQVVNRCFQIMQVRTESSWRRHCDLVISPDVRGIDWDAFGSGPELILAGEAAALAAMPAIEAWFPKTRKAPAARVPVPSSLPA